MSNVMGLHAAGVEPASSAFRRVRRASRLFSWLFTALLWALSVLAAAMALAMLIYAGPHLQVTSHSFELTNRTNILPGAVVVGTLPFATKLAYAIVAVLRTAPAVMMFWNLRALFRLYSQGVVFASENTAAIKRVGLWLVAAAFMPFASHMFLSALGREVDHAWFHMEEVQALVLGGLVFVIAQVMQVGREIEEDRSQFV